MEAVSDNDSDYESDDDIVGEVVYHDDYLRSRGKRRKMSSSSEGDEEYNWDEENPEEEEEEEEEEDMLSTSEDSDEPRRSRALPGRTRRETRLRLADGLQSGLRRSKRASRNHINYRLYDGSESDNEPMKSEKASVSSEHSNASEDTEFSIGSQNSDEKIEPDMNTNEPMKLQQQQLEMTDTTKQSSPLEETNQKEEEEPEGAQERRYLDLNELAPGPGFEDGP